MKSFWNSLRFQILVIFVFVGIVIPLSIYIGAGFSISANLAELKVNQLGRSTARINKNWETIGHNLIHNVEDYAYWDEMYNNMSAPNHSWFKENVSEWVTKRYDFNLVILTDMKGKVLEYLGPAKDRGTFAGRVEISKATKGSISGFMELSDGLYFFAATSVRNNVGKGEPRGVLLVGSKTSPLFLCGISAPFSQNMAIYHQGKLTVQDFMTEKESQETNFPGHLMETLVRKGGEAGFPDEMVTFTPESDKIYSFTTLKDISGKPIALMVVGDSRGTFNTTSQHLKLLSAVFLLTPIPFILTLGWYLYRKIVYPLLALRKTIEQAREHKKTFLTTAHGSQEFNELAAAFNEMAVALDEQRMLEEENQALALLANTDSLTGLYNRRYFYERLRETLAMAHSQNSRFSILFLDVDRLKYINDVYGHLKGDEVIQMIGRIVGNMAGTRDTAARYGGDEFAIILPEAGPAEAARLAGIITEQIKVASSTLGIFLPHQNLSLSAGIATYPDSGQTAEELINAADIELFNTKNFSQRKIGTYWPLLTKVEWMDRDDLYNYARMSLVFIDCMDRYTLYHTERVVQGVEILACQMGLDKKEKETLKTAALFHDIGKLEVGATILNKKEPLTEAEWDIIKMHPIWGANIVGAVEDLQDTVPIIRHHHERYDGRGYPDGLQGEEIPLGSRILAVIDSFDALTTNRVYRPAFGLKEAVEEIRRSSGTQLDPVVVETFLNVAVAIFEGRIELKKM